MARLGSSAYRVAAAVQGAEATGPAATATAAGEEMVTEELAKGATGTTAVAAATASTLLCSDPHRAHLLCIMSGRGLHQHVTL